MLISKIDESMMMCQRYLDSKKASDDSKKLEELKNVFTTVNGKVQTFVVYKRDLFEADASFDVDTTVLLNYLAYLRENVTEKDFVNAKRNLEDVEKEVSSCRSELEARWREYCSNRIDANKRLISLFNHLIDDDGSIINLVNLERKISSISIGNKKIIEAIEQYNDKCEQLLKSLSIGPNVKSFIMKISQGRDVTLADLNKDVLEWVDSTGLVDKFVISIKE